MFNGFVSRLLPFIPKTLVRVVASKYIAGETVFDAMNAAKMLNSCGCVCTIDMLGEFVTSRDQVDHEVNGVISIIQSIHSTGVESGVSVKLTSLGLDIDFEFCKSNMRTILEAAKQHDIFVRIDMENTPYTSQTIQLFNDLYEEYGARLGLVFQAYLRRTEDDISGLFGRKTSVRLCKGIYKESPEHAFQTREEIQANYKRLLSMLLENGIYTGIATHDDVLLQYAMDYIETHDIPAENYEFQMLLGVRESKRRELLRLGHKVRVYVPFGKDWYGYSVRRLKENPEMAGNIVKAFLKPGS